MCVYIYFFFFVNNHACIARITIKHLQMQTEQTQHKLKTKVMTQIHTLGISKMLRDLKRHTEKALSQCVYLLSSERQEYTNLSMY